MGGKIIHYGMGENPRLRTLQNAGYTIESCSSLSELKWVLYSGGRADAVAFTETIGKAPRSAIALARSKRCPLVLFQGSTPHYDASEFNLLVPRFAPDNEWLGDIAKLIEHSQSVVRASTELRTQSRQLRNGMREVHEKVILEFRRSERETQRNREFHIDFLRTEATHQELRTLSGQSGFLRSLSNDAMLEFNSLVRFSSHPAGTVLFAETQFPREIFIILAGRVKLSVDSSDGKRFIVHFANPGEMLGLASVFTSCAHEATAETCYPCDLGSVNSSDFLNFLDKHTHAFRAAAYELGCAYNQTCARLRTMGVNLTVMAKMAGLLLEWSESGNETERGTQIHVGLTHVEIGQCIGIARETVTRILHDFQHRQIIDQQGAKLTILDRTALETYAGER